MNRNSCRFYSREDIPSEEMAAELGHFGGIRAIHYTLNLTINRDMHTSYQGTVEIMVHISLYYSFYECNISSIISQYPFHTVL